MGIIVLGSRWVYLGTYCGINGDDYYMYKLRLHYIYVL